MATAPVQEELARRPRPRAARLALVLLILALGGLAFLARFNALGGALGGFDDDEFLTLTRVDLLFDGQQPLRDFADNELRGVWPSLSFELPALAQSIWGRNLLVHAVYTLTAVSVCAVVVFLLARNLSRQWGVALLSALAVILSWTVPYNYQKLLSMTLGIAAIRWALLKPSPARFLALAAVSLVATLFRHDYGLFVGLAALAGIVGSQVRPIPVPARRITMYLALTVLVSLPSAIWVSLNGGILDYLRVAFESSTTQSGNNPAMWFDPVFSFTRPFAFDSLVAFNYYAAWAFVPGALVVLVMVLRRGATGRYDPEAGTGWALVTMTLLVNFFLLRSSLPARFGDAVVPMALIAPWMAGQAHGCGTSLTRRLGVVMPVTVLALMCAAFVSIEEVPRELRTGGFLEGSPSVVVERFLQVKHELQALPPRHWTVSPSSGSMAAARYVAECTADTDYVLMATFADQIPYFARRHFAGGQSYFAFSFLRTEADQRRVLQRLDRQSVPMVLAAFDYQNEIVEAYPLVARRIAERYTEAGVIELDGDPWLRVFVEKTRSPVRMDATLGLPCFR